MICCIINIGINMENGNGKRKSEIGNRNLENEGTSTIYCIINLGIKMENGNGTRKSEITNSYTHHIRGKL